MNPVQNYTPRYFKLQALNRPYEYHSIISPQFIHKTSSIKTNGLLYVYKRNYKIDQI